MIFEKAKTVVIIAACTLASVTASAQDLLASQAPIDRKMKSVDSLSLQQLINNEVWEAPAADLYEDWDNVNASIPETLPNKKKINLRDYCMPTTSRVVTSNFGARWGRQHKGLDIKVYIGDTIRAAFSGKVRIVSYEARGYGKYIMIRHPNGLETVYGHLSKQLVHENQMVKAGDPIGLGGNTGRSTGSHLHFETRLGGVALNPAIMFDFKNQDVVYDEWTFDRSTYNKLSAESTKLRGSGIYRGGDGLFDNASSSKVIRSKASKGKSKGKGKSRVQKSNSRQHVVKSGETLYSIAKKNNTTVEKICKDNGLNKNATIKAGKKLNL